jgi:hypothetical protein
MLKKEEAEHEPGPLHLPRDWEQDAVVSGFRVPDGWLWRVMPTARRSLEPPSPFRKRTYPTRSDTAAGRSVTGSLKPRHWRPL